MKNMKSINKNQTNKPI